RKPIWFEEIKQKLLEGPNTQKIKPNWQRDRINTFTPRAKLLKIIKKSDKSWIKFEHWYTEKDKSAHTTKLKKCSACHINEDLDSAGINCVLRRQLQKAEKFILEIPLECLDKKRNQVQIIDGKPCIDGLQISTIEIVIQEEELINTHLEESQA
ncbi:16920_t:CDS:2, partial [Gigaspora rosea]